MLHPSTYWLVPSVVDSCEWLHCPFRLCTNSHFVVSWLRLSLWFLLLLPSPKLFLWHLTEISVSLSLLCQSETFSSDDIIILLDVLFPSLAILGSNFLDFPAKSSEVFSKLRVQLGCYHSSMALLCMPVMRDNGQLHFLFKCLTVCTARSASPFPCE